MNYCCFFTIFQLYIFVVPYVRSADFGRDLSSVQLLLNKHDTFDNGLNTSEQITAKRDQIFERWDQLKAALIEKPSKLGESQTLQQFSRDADEVENWIAEKFQVAQKETHKNPTNIQQKHQKQQVFLSQEDTTGDNVESQIKKREDFDKAIASQQEKLNNLDTLARQLVQAGHYAAPQITAKRDRIFERWHQLKAALIEKPSNLGESQTLQQFSRDADEVENWIAEKFQVAQEETYRDPTNIQQKHQKQQLINSGNHHAKNIGTRTEQFFASVGENMAAVQGLLKKHDTFEVDLQMHQQRSDEMRRQGEQNLIGRTTIAKFARQQPAHVRRFAALNGRFAPVLNLVGLRRALRTTMAEGVQPQGKWYNHGGRGTTTVIKRDMPPRDDNNNNNTHQNQLTNQHAQLEAMIEEDPELRAILDVLQQMGMPIGVFNTRAELIAALRGMAQRLLEGRR
ncbi:hypothetical protein niasHT_004112 [Heterodera trifolii]|uniref:Uncharacterized protein n=1 Tax=Heterodera trifolii TaxID=157864 RepID=A0ABD2LSK7_9BILA